MPKMSRRHSTGSMIAAAETGEITSERSGGDTPPTPPMPPFEMPVRKTAKIPSAQNQGSLGKSTLVRLDVGLLDELAVLADFLGDHILEILHRAGERIAAELLDLRHDLWRIDDGGDVVVELLDDRARRLGRHQRADPEVVGGVLQPLLLERRDVRHQRAALGRAG